MRGVRPDGKYTGLGLLDKEKRGLGALQAGPGTISSQVDLDDTSGC